MYAFKRFMKMMDSSAKTLHACVCTRHYEKITGTLDKMTLPEGTMLMVNECEKYDRAVSHLYLSDERTLRRFIRKTEICLALPKGWSVPAISFV